MVAMAKFSPDGLFIATATSLSQSIRIYQTKNGRLFANFKIEVGSRYNQFIAWHNDSKRIFVASLDGHIHLLDVSIKKTLSKWRIHDRFPACITLSSDNTFIAASAGQSVSFWDITTHKQIGSLVKYASDVFSVDISLDHDLLMGTHNTIVLQDLCDILPLHYCNSARKLCSKFAGLQSRCESQSRNLVAVRKKVQIATLTRELDHRKHSVAMKMDELAAVRRELDQLPNVSRELVVTRNDLRMSEAHIHRVYRYHNTQLRKFTSAVAEAQPESPDIQRGVGDSDVYAEKLTIRTLESLNTVIQRTSISISTYFIRYIRSPNTEEQSLAAQRISELIPPALVDRLQTVSHHDLSSYLSITFQAYLTSYAYTIASSWTMNKRTDEFLSKAYEQLRKSGKLSISGGVYCSLTVAAESQMFAAGWRALIHANTPVCTTSDRLISDTIQGLSDIVVAAGCAASTSDTVSKMLLKFWHNISSIVWTAENLRALIGNALVVDFKVVTARPAQIFDEASMVLHSAGGRGVAVGRTRGKRVLCSVGLGLVKEVIQESLSPGQRNTLAALTVVRTAVILPESR